MKTKIRMSLGLALVLVVGVLATILVLGNFSISSVQAAEKPPEQGGLTLGVVDPGNQPLTTLVIDADVGTLSLVSPATFDDANLTELTITIGSSTGPPVALLEVAVAQFLVDNGPQDFQRTDFTTALDASTSTTGTFVATFVISFTNTDKVTLAATTIDVSADITTAGSMLIDQEGSVTPTAYKRLEPPVGPSSSRLHDNTTDLGWTNNVALPASLQLSLDDAVNRDKPLTVFGEGFKKGTSVTIWLDSNQNGVRDSGEIDLITMTIGSCDCFDATFVVTVPPFSTGTGNTINAITDENRLSTPKNISMATDPFADSGNPNVMGTTTGFFTEATRSGDITFRDQQGSDWQAAMHQNRLTTVEIDTAIDERMTSAAFLAGEQRFSDSGGTLSGTRPLTAEGSLVNQTITVGLMRAPYAGGMVGISPQLVL